jgi:RND family efflux transporter MFP subunit
MAVHHFKPRTASPEQPSAEAATRPHRRPGAWTWVVAALAIAAATAGGWWLLRPLPVTLGQARTGPAVEAVYASGVVEYVRQARIAPVSTAPIKSVLVREGDRVKPGQVMAQLEDGPQQATYLQLEALAAQARAATDRQRRLFAAGFGARAAFEDAETQQRAAEAAAASARAHLRDFQLLAPFAGQVLRRDAEPGDLASVGKPLFVVADPNSLRVTADADERDVGRLTRGMQAVVRADAFPGQTFPATVSEITPQGDAQGRVFRVRLQLGSGTPLKPGMTVETNLVIARRENATLAPAAALKDKSVWVVENGRAHQRKVVSGAAGAEAVEIVQGLEPGATLILNPPAALRDGRRVAAKSSR